MPRRVGFGFLESDSDSEKKKEKKRGGVLMLLRHDISHAVVFGKRRRERKG